MFVERKELELLKEKLDRTVENATGTAVFLSGEPGIGKSTLIQHFLDDCDKYYDVNILTGSGYCFDMDGVSRGYLPWKEVLIELDADKMAGKDSEKKNSFKKMVKSVFDNSGSEWFQNIPAVGDISAAIMETAKAIKKTEKVDTETGDIMELTFKDRLKYAFNNTAGAWLGAIPIIGGIAEAIFSTSRKMIETSKDIHLKNQEGFFLMVDNRLRELAEENPIVVFFDNLQWADNSSLSLLYYIARKMVDKPYPLMIIGAYRTQEIKEGRFNEVTGLIERHPLEEKVNNLVRYNAVELVELDKFSPDQAYSFINNKFPGNTFDSAFSGNLFHLTKGNPLYLEEILNNLYEKGTIELSNDQYILRESIESIQLPDSITAIIKERFERLPDELQEFLQMASVQGEMFSVDIISSILEEQSLKTYRKNDTLINKHRLVEKSRKIAEGLGDMYQISHNLIKNYIYYNMSDDYRLNIHRQIAEQYRDIDQENVLLEFIFHYGVGNRIIDEKRNFVLDLANTDKAVVSQYLEAQSKVANLYIKSFKNDEGISICSEIIKIATLMNDVAMKVQFLLKQGDIYRIIGKWDDSLNSFQLAFQFALLLSDKTILANTAEALSELLRMQAKTNEKIGEWNKAENMYRESLLYSEHTMNLNLIANSFKNMSWILTLLGRYVESVLNIEKAIETYDNTEESEVRTTGLSSIKSLLNKSIQVCKGIGDENGIQILMNAVNKLEHCLENK